MITTLLELFWSFLKIGFTSFGGLSMIPLISHEVISHGWMNLGEVGDIVAIAEMTPGPLGFNCATFAGIHAAGIPGAAAACRTAAKSVVCRLHARRLRNSAVYETLVGYSRSRCEAGVRREESRSAGVVRRPDGGFAA